MGSCCLESWSFIAIEAVRCKRTRNETEERAEEGKGEKVAGEARHATTPVLPHESLAQKPQHQTPNSLPTPSPPTPLRHSLHLLRALNLRHPLDPLGRKQLGAWLRLLERIHIVHNPDLDDHQAREGAAGAVQRRAAVATEVVGDLLAAVARLGEGFRRAGYDLEAAFGDRHVRAVG